MTNLAKLLLFLAFGLLALFLSFFLTEAQKLHYVVIYLSYPNLFIIFSLLAVSLYHTFRYSPEARRLFRLNWWELLIIIAGGYFLLLFEPFGFKIIFDELILSSTALMMHVDRLAGMPQMGNDLQGSYILLDSILDKRPLVFPFVLSTLHDLIGYRYQNVFILNGLLTFLLVFLVYTFSRRISGRKSAILAVCLMVNLPLLSTFATSGHFEILNLIGLMCTLIWGYLYIRKPGPDTLVPLVLFLVILSQIRYENSLYILPFGILILAGWRKSGKIILPWQVIITPLFFTLYAMHYRLIFSQSDSFQEGPNGRLDTFSLSYIPDNLTSGVEYLFSIGQESSNSLLISLIGLTAVLFFCAYAFNRSRELTGRDPKGTILFFFLMAIFLFSIVISIFNFGLFKTYITNRLSLPLHLFLVICGPFILKRYGKHFILGLVLITLLSGVLTVFFMDPSSLAIKGIQYGIGILAATAFLFWIWKAWKQPVMGLVCLSVVFLLTTTMPIAHPSRYTQKHKPPLTIQHELRFLNSFSEGEKILWISPGPYTALLSNVSCIPMATIRRNPKVLKHHFEDRNYTRIFTARLWEQGKDGEFVLMNKSENFDTDILTLEPHKEFPITQRLLYRIEEITGVNLPEPDADADTEIGSEDSEAGAASAIDE